MPELTPASTPELAPGLQAYVQHLRVERRLAQRTLTLYTQALRRLQAAAQAARVDLPLAQPHHLRGWAAQLRAQGLAPRSLALVLSAWRGLFGWWARQGLLSANPLGGLRAPKAARPLPKALSVEQAVALAGLLPAARTSPAQQALAVRDHAIAELLYGCGLRVAELTGLEVSASRAARGWVDLADASVYVLGKGSKRRSVPVGAAAAQALQAWLARRATLARSDEPALFVSARGTRLSPNALRVRLRALAVQAGLPTRVHPHMLRHSFASHLLQSSGDLRAVQELLGHTSISTTQVYTRLDHLHLSRIYDAAHPRAHRKEAKT